MSNRRFNLSSNISLGDDQPLLLIAGPCQLESRDHALMIASELLKRLKDLPINLVFKGSFDKANRTSVSGKRGVGIEAGLQILNDVRKQTGLSVLTDVHSAHQVPDVAAAVDILQTPAFLCRQTDLLEAAGKSGKPVNIKKGQFLAPEDMRFCAQKVTATGNNNVLLCERGASFGYRDLVVDMRSLVIMREIGFPVVFDATHSVQQLGGVSGQSGGARHFIAPLARAAAAVGIDGLFLECHEAPQSAPSDSASMLPLDSVRSVVESVCRIRKMA